MKTPEERRASRLARIARIMSREFGREILVAPTPWPGDVEYRFQRRHKPWAVRYTAVYAVKAGVVRTPREVRRDLAKILEGEAMPGPKPKREKRA